MWLSLWNFVEIRVWTCHGHQDNMTKCPCLFRCQGVVPFTWLAPLRFCKCVTCRPWTVPCQTAPLLRLCLCSCSCLEDNTKTTVVHHWQNYSNQVWMNGWTNNYRTNPIVPFYWEWKKRFLYLCNARCVKKFKRFSQSGPHYNSTIQQWHIKVPSFILLSAL